MGMISPINSMYIYWYGLFIFFKAYNCNVSLLLPFYSYYIYAYCQYNKYYGELDDFLELES